MDESINFDAEWLCVCVLNLWRWENSWQKADKQLTQNENFHRSIYVSQKSKGKDNFFHFVAKYFFVFRIFDSMKLLITPVHWAFASRWLSPRRHAPLMSTNKQKIDSKNSDARRRSQQGETHKRRTMTKQQREKAKRFRAVDDEWWQDKINLNFISLAYFHLLVVDVS